MDDKNKVIPTEERIKYLCVGSKTFKGVRHQVCENDVNVKIIDIISGSVSCEYFRNEKIRKHQSIKKYPPIRRNRRYVLLEKKVSPIVYKYVTNKVQSILIK